MTRRMHLGAHLPGIDTASGQAGFGLLADIARTAERGRFDFLVRGEDGSDTCTVLAALAAVTDRVGLVGTVDPAVAQPYHAARRWASLDHLCAGRAAWHIDPVGGGSDRAESFLTAAHTLFDAWRTDDIIADKAAGKFLSRADAGEFAYQDRHFDIVGRFGVPRSPQARPVVFRGGDRDANLESAARSADILLSGHREPTQGRAFYADVKGRLARHGRHRDQLLILATAPAVSADAEAVAEQLDTLVQTDAVDGFVLAPPAAPDGLDEFVDSVVPLLQQRGVLRTDYEGRTLRAHLGLEHPGH